MKHYSKSLDLLIAAQQFALKGNSEKAAKLFARAIAQKDLKPTLAALERLQARNYAAEQAAVASAPKTAAQVIAAKNAKQKKVKADSQDDIFNSTIDEMTVEADLDDVMELPVAGTDSGFGESSEDVGNDDASDLDFSPSEELGDGDFDDADFGDDLEGLDDLGDLSDEDFGLDDIDEGDDVLANTTGEGDVDTREDTTEDPNDTPEGQTSPGLPPVPKAEDTTVTSKVKPAGITKLNRVHANLAALQKMQRLTTVARVATPKPKK